MTLQVNNAFTSELVTDIINAIQSSGLHLDIFSGTIPDVDVNYTFTATNYSAQKLVGYTNTQFSLQNVSGVLRFNIMPPQINATASGTATWFALYNGTSAVIGTITDQTDGTGVLLLQSTNIVSGSPVNVLELGVRFS